MGNAGVFQGFVFQQKYAESEPFSHTQNLQITTSFQQMPQPPVKAACFQRMTEMCKLIKQALREYLHHFRSIKLADAKFKVRKGEPPSSNTHFSCGNSCYKMLLKVYTDLKGDEIITERRRHPGL